jgi:hypothetical protein
VTSSYKYANQVNPEGITAGTQRFDATPAKVYGAEDFAATPTKLTDASLGSRAYSSPAQTLPANVPIGASVYQQTNMPDYLQTSIDALNSEQYQKRALQQDLLNRLFAAAESGDYTAYEALRAAAIQPGAKASFGSYIVSPEVQSSQAGAIQETAKKTAAETKAVNRPSQLLQQLQQTQTLRARIGQNPFGMYQGSEQQKLDQKIMDLEAQLRSDSATTQVAAAAARPNVISQSAWIAPMNPVGGVALPRF